MSIAAAVPGPAPDQPKGLHLSKELPTELVIGALVPPVLLGLLASRLAADVMTQVGLISEQIYRGERLPTLNVMATKTAP